MRRLFDKVLVEIINEGGNNGKGKKKAVSANTAVDCIALYQNKLSPTQATQIAARMNAKAGENEDLYYTLPLLVGQHFAIMSVLGKARFDHQ